MGSGTLKLMEWLDVAQLALPEAKACVQVNHLGLLMSVSVLVIRRLLSNGHHKPGRPCSERPGFGGLDQTQSESKPKYMLPKMQFGTARREDGYNCGHSHTIHLSIHMAILKSLLSTYYVPASGRDPILVFMELSGEMHEHQAMTRAW